MPIPGPRNIRQDLYTIAYGRVMTVVMKLVNARKVAMRVDIDPGCIASQGLLDTHQIQLTCGRYRQTIPVDHETFMDEEFFRTLVLHQVEAVIEELATPDRQRSGEEALRGSPPALAAP